MNVLADSVFEMTMTYDCNDVIVFFVNINYMTNFSKKEVNKLLSLSRVTNLILCLKYDYSYLTDQQRNFLLYIENYVNDVKNKSLRVVYNEANNGVTRLNKPKLCKIISDYVLCKETSKNFVLKSLATDSFINVSTNFVNYLHPECVVDLTLDKCQSSDRVIEVLPTEIVNNVVNQDSDNIGHDSVINVPCSNSVSLGSELSGSSSFMSVNGSEQNYNDNTSKSCSSENHHFLYPRLSRWNLKEN